MTTNDQSRHSPPDETTWRAVARRHDPARSDSQAQQQPRPMCRPRRRIGRPGAGLAAVLAAFTVVGILAAAPFWATASPDVGPAAHVQDREQDDLSTEPGHPVRPGPPPGLPFPTDDGRDKVCTPGDPLPMCNLPTMPRPSQDPGDHDGPGRSGPPSSSRPPCTGEGCLPNPTLEPPGSEAKNPRPRPYEPPDECGITDPIACITEGIDALFRGIVTSALNPMLKLLGDTLLATPTLDKLPQVGPLWDVSWHILLACYGTLVLLAGLLLMGFETFQTRYTVKEVAPRLVVGFLAGFLSLWVAEKAIRIANGLSGALLGGGLDPGSTGAVLRTMVLNAISGGGLWLLLMGLALAVMIVALLITYIIRIALTVILLIGAPMALMFHALPQTEGIARWWWRALGAVLAIQVVQSLTLIVALKVFFDPSGFSPFGPNRSGLVSLLVALALIYVLLRTPGMLLRAAGIGGGGRTFLGSLVRGYVAYKAFGALTRRSPGPNTSTTAVAAPRRKGGHRGSGGPGLAGAGRTRGGARGNEGAGSPGESDPYARTRATADGQLILPLTAPRRPKPGGPSSAATGKTARPNGAVPPPVRPGVRRGRQLALPLGDDWPENRPVLGRDGQYRLPFPVERVRPNPADAPAGGGPVPGASPARRGRPRSRHLGRQLELPFDPYKGIRPLRSGQYPLPLEITRPQRRSASPQADGPTAAVGPAAARPRPPDGAPNELPRPGPRQPGRPRSRGGQQLRLPLPKPGTDHTGAPPQHPAARPAKPATPPRSEGEPS